MKQKIQSEIKNYFNSFSELNLNNDFSNKNWTKTLKYQIGEIGEKFGFTICTAGFKEFQKEWLYDQV